MANVRTGSIIADIAGSVGDECYGRGQGGLYVRSKPIPSYTNTSRQQSVRGAMTACSQAWSDTLTEEQRHAWRQYASTWPRPSWTVPAKLKNGYTRFCRTNLLWRRAFGAIVYNDPPPKGPIHPPLFTFTVQKVADTFTIALPIANYDPPPVPLIVYVFVGDRNKAGVAYYSSPWRYGGSNTWDAGWSTDPWVANYPFFCLIGERVYAYMIAQNYDTGEISTRYQTSAIAQ